MCLCTLTIVHYFQRQCLVRERSTVVDIMLGRVVRTSEAACYDVFLGKGR